MTIVSDTIFSLGSDNKTLRAWQYEVEGDKWRGRFGIVGGRVTTSKWSTATAKNIGKANERDAEAQALFEAQAEEAKKLDREYRRTGAELDSVPPAVMLAEDYTKLKKPMNWGSVIAAQPKLDGIRLVATKLGGHSREFQPFGASVDRVREALAPVFAKYPDLTLDGELYNHSLKHDFNTLASTIRKKKLTEAEAKAAQEVVEYHVYDMPSSERFADRHERLLHLFEEFDFSLDPIVLVPTCFPTSAEELDEAYAQWLADGYEGQMVRLDDPYAFGVRSWSLMKRKTFVTEEFEVVRLIEGNGNWAGCAKAVEFKMPNGALTEQGELPKCGMRGTEDFARALLAGPTPKIVTVRHLGLTPGGVPRGPVAIDFDRKD